MMEATTWKHAPGRDGAGCSWCGDWAQVNDDCLCEDCFDEQEHDEHEWGEVETSRFSGNPHRKCQVAGCNVITLDLSDDEEDEELFDIVRFRFDGDNEIIKEGVTREEAVEHCEREDTHGDGWFDGFRSV